MLHYSRTVEIEWGDCDASGLMHTERYFALFDGNLWRMLEQVWSGRCDTCWARSAPPDFQLST